MNPKLLRHYSNILNEAPGDGTFQNDPNVGAGAKAIGNALSGFFQGGSAGTSGRGGSGKPSAPLPSNPSAPAYNTGKAGPAKLATQNFNAPAGGSAKPTAKPAAPNYGAAVKSANAAFAANQAKAPQGVQDPSGQGNSFLPGAAGGAKPAAAPAPAAASTPAPQANALGIAPQANVPGMQTEPAAPAPQANALGIAPQANVPGMQTGTAPASQGAKPAPGPVGLGSAIGAPGMATASNPASVNPPTVGGPQVTGSANMSTDSDDVIAKRGPMGIQMKEEELEEELNELMRLSGRPMQEKAPSTTKVTEGLSLTEGGGTLDHLKNRFKHEVKNFMAHGQMDSDLYHALYDYYRDTGEIPYSAVKDDPHSWVEERFYMDMGSGMSEGMIDVAPSTELTELARLAGLSESQVAECGDMDMKQDDSMNVSTNMNSDGNKSVSISAQGDKADALLQMLKMAGMRPHDDHDHVGMTEPEIIMMGNEPRDQMMDEAASQRLIDKLGDSALGAKVYKDLEWGEYVVKFIKDGKLTSDESWYHTDDLDDAMSTAQKELQFMQQRGNNEMMEDSGGMQVHDLSRMSGRELYDETQTNDDIHDGDVLVTDSGVGIMVEAWPVMVAGEIQGFHKLADTTWEEFEGGKYLDSYNKAMEVSGSVQEEYANEPEEEYQTIDSIIRQGNDLNREKRQYADKPKLGDNPMAEDVMLDEELASLLDSILVREEMTDVLKAEQPYKDEKTGKMVTPPKGATMPPADTPPAPKVNVKK